MASIAVTHLRQHDNEVCEIQRWEPEGEDEYPQRERPIRSIDRLRTRHHR